MHILKKLPNKSQIYCVQLSVCAVAKAWFGLVWFICSSVQSHCNIGHVNYRLQFTTYLVIYRHPHNTI